MQAFLDVFTARSGDALISSRSAMIAIARVTRAFNNAVDCALEVLEYERVSRLRKRGWPGVSL